MAVEGVFDGEKGREGGKLAHGGDDVRDLPGELSGRGEADGLQHAGYSVLWMRHSTQGNRKGPHLGLLKREVGPAKHSERERGRLARSRLRLSDHILWPGVNKAHVKPREVSGRRPGKKDRMPGKGNADARVLEEQRQRALLDLGRLLELHGVDALEQVGVTARTSPAETSVFSLRLGGMWSGTHRPRSSNDLTLNSGELGSACWSASVTWEKKHSKAERHRREPI